MASDELRQSWVTHPEQLETVINSVKREHAMRVLLDKMLLRLRYQRPIIADPDPMRPYRDVSAFETLIQLGFNTVRKVIDAARSRVCKQLRPIAIPVGADLETERTCTLLSRTIDGVLDCSKYWTFHAPQVFADACTVTMGHLEWYVDPESCEILCERVDPLSVFWHYDEGRNPAHLYYEMPASKTVLAAHYPQHHDASMALPTWKVPTIIGVEPPGIRGTESVRVCKGWRRKLGKQPGHQTVTAGKIVLKDESYDHDFFPLAACRWDQDFRGYGGYPGAAVLAPYQRWRNTLIRLVFDSLKGAVPWVMIHEDDVIQNVSDVPFQRVAWSGSREPKIQVNNPVSEQLLAFCEKLDAEAHAEFGMNQQASEGTLPPGITSAPGQRERIALIDSRLSRLQDAWEGLAVDSARIIIALASDAYKNKSVRVRAPGATLFEEIKWPFDIKANQYVVQFAKVSGLSSTGWGRIQELGELRDRGAITEGEYLRQLELPDSKGTADRVNAPQDLALHQISQALDEAIFTMPSELQGKGLDTIVEMGAQIYQRAKLTDKYPPKNLECLRRFIQAADALRKGVTAKPPVMPVAASLPGQPAGVAPAPLSVLPLAPALPPMPSAPPAPPPPTPPA